NDKDTWSGYSHQTVNGSGAGVHFRMRARFPGKYGDARVTFTLKVGQNMLTTADNENRLRSVSNRDLVLLRNAGSGSAGAFYLALWDAQNESWVLSQTDSLTGPHLTLASLNAHVQEVRIVTVTVTVQPLTVGAQPFVAADLSLDPSHTRGGTPDSV